MVVFGIVWKGGEGGGERGGGKGGKEEKGGEKRGGVVRGVIDKLRYNIFVCIFLVL